MCGSSVSVALLMCGSAGSAGSVDVWQCGVWETGRQHSHMCSLQDRNKI